MNSKFEFFDCIAHQNSEFETHVFGDEAMSKTLEIPLYHVRLPATNPRAIGNETNTKSKVNVFSAISKRGCLGILVIYFFLNCF